MRKKWMKIKKRKLMNVKGWKRMIEAVQPAIEKTFTEYSKLFDLFFSPQELAERQGWTRCEGC